MTRKPKAPPHLDKIAQEKWTELLPELPDSEPATLDAAACYSAAYSRWQQAEEKIRELGPVIRGSGGTAAVSPYVAVAAQAQRQMRQWLTELKLTPQSRKGQQQHKRNPLQILTAQGGNAK